MTEEERALGRLAAKVVRNAGGFLTFDQYDEAMRREVYFAPLSWCQGWGLTAAAFRANQDKLCAFAAVRNGLLVQTDLGYWTTHSARTTKV